MPGGLAKIDHLFNSGVHPFNREHDSNCDHEDQPFNSRDLEQQAERKCAETRSDLNPEIWLGKPKQQKTAARIHKAHCSFVQPEPQSGHPATVARIIVNSSENRFLAFRSVKLLQPAPCFWIRLF